MCTELRKKLLKEIQAVGNNLALLEKLLVNEEYIMVFRDDPDYVKCWLQYSGMVQDVDSVFEFMDEA